MNEQLSLFVDENTLFNKALERLLDMDFKGCMESLAHYARLYPWGRSIERERDMCVFWLDCLGERPADEWGPEEAERRYRVWLKFEERFGYPWPDHEIEKHFGERYFSRIAKGLDGHAPGSPVRLPDGTPTGLIYLRGGAVAKAIASLQRLVAVDREDAGAYGYLGDAFALSGDLTAARACYLKAFAINSEEVDIHHLLDREAKDRLGELDQDERAEGDPVGWFPSIAILEGFFEPVAAADVDEVKTWRKRYERLLEAQAGNGDPSLIPRLFAHALILAENGRTLGLTGDFDLIEVRRKMKAWRPDLFASYMARLEELETGPRKRTRSVAGAHSK
ncbi:MAG: hypothetical protein AB1512_04210 [Thermodesulfobacteriota bacterium]